MTRTTTSRALAILFVGAAFSSGVLAAPTSLPPTGFNLSSTEAQLSNSSFGQGSLSESQPAKLSHGVEDANVVSLGQVGVDRTFKDSPKHDQDSWTEDDNLDSIKIPVSFHAKEHRADLSKRGWPSTKLGGGSSSQERADERDRLLPTKEEQKRLERDRLKAQQEENRLRSEARRKKDREEKRAEMEQRALHPSSSSSVSGSLSGTQELRHRANVAPLQVGDDRIVEDPKQDQDGIKDDEDSINLASKVNNVPVSFNAGENRADHSKPGIEWTFLHIKRPVNAGRRKKQKRGEAAREEYRAQELAKYEKMRQELERQKRLLNGEQLTVTYATDLGLGVLTLTNWL
ncbi:hypothetical protein C8R42DRAFT_723072 [Lentinula raphanica]|nr:hypothetical protein C8R42DRAFT_723072 [Lentinula raphanica]